eukprot:CAMPEP_0203811400 /NCGR_PEP_ID=MMETSP0115-20131106/3538_1 /ASSEMBLY_ACC=CAM_ASM_000227 /TAXON_ID=33651 /ORGANISM="Bicosoecid sp, Strain ms1" /LENGTH=51 /DNA_ID=CAMNT_0050720225 /DNA_START=35 /DNA_END=186 /DNA_ORIENTATION=-
MEMEEGETDAEFAERMALADEFEAATAAVLMERDAKEAAKVQRQLDAEGVR